MSLELNIFQKINKKIIGSKNIKANIKRIHENYLIMHGYFCIRFINFVLKDKSLLDSSNLFSPKNDKIMLEYFQ